MTKRELIVTPNHDGRGRSVVVDRHVDGRFRIAIDGRWHDVDAREIRPGTWSLIIDNTSVVVDLDHRRTRAGATVVASVGASEVALVVEDGTHATLAKHTVAGREVASRGEKLRAPIAGKVVKLSVAVGDVVAAHTSVIAIEAMKMENELVCERGGTVTAIHKQVGQAVDSGDVLVEFG